MFDGDMGEMGITSEGQHTAGVDQNFEVNENGEPVYLDANMDDNMNGEVAGVIQQAQGVYQDDINDFGVGEINNNHHQNLKVPPEHNMKGERLDPNGKGMREQGKRPQNSVIVEEASQEDKDMDVDSSVRARDQQRS